MNRFTKCRVVMLPTEKATEGGIFKMLKGPHTSKLFIAKRKEIGNHFFEVPTESTRFVGIYQPQHLYFVSDEEIKEGDWMLLNNCIIRQCKNPEAFHYYIKVIEDTTGGKHSPSVCKKIIASTDKSLNLPSCSNGFIKKYVDLNGDVKEVKVEYEMMNDFGEPYTFDDLDFGVEPEYKLKVTPNKNISIHPIQEVFNRSEMISKLWRYNQEAMLKCGVGTPMLSKESFDEWIEENV